MDTIKATLNNCQLYDILKAKLAGEQEGKWLIVNIQDSKEFKCQQLNRDVWSNEAVRNIMAEHFILWQVRIIICRYVVA